MLERLVIGAAKLFKGPPLVRSVLTDKDLTRIALASEIDLLSINLVWNVNQEHVEEVVGNVVWLEDNLNFI